MFKATNAEEMFFDRLDWKSPVIKNIQMRDIPEDQKLLQIKLFFGFFDEIIFFDKIPDAEFPQIPDDLQLIISQDNYEFVMHLLFKATTKKELEFWFDHGAVLRSNDIISAITLRCKKFVFEYFEEQGCFKPLVDFVELNDGFFFKRSSFMAHVARLAQSDSEASNYIKQILFNDQYQSPVPEAGMAP